ncbi:hypothetical protein DVW83_07835 [Enterococcus sp. VV15]|uniref:hypothetical protein n=1 Tax=Enterococcus sp. VV15 TaxID=2233541 RepID=UPI0010C19009|nr:hypothetical protein [Enterococcus sp. VV15]TKN17733.1 hypothetical protein DVW83_07835 [Enterococcus sp. VV15]
MISKKMMGTMAVLGMMLAGGTLVNAESRIAPTQKAIPVTYDNRNVLPDGNGQYGMVIPTAISFTDEEPSADASIEIIGINGFNLSDWKKLSVTVKVKSANSYTLKNINNQTVPYTLTMDGNNTAFESNATEQSVTKKFGIGIADVAQKVTGTAMLNGKGLEKGQYSDQLTYIFEENENELK